MASVWDEVQARWPVDGQDYDSVRKEMEAYLSGLGLDITGFNHYGIVVRDAEEEMSRLQKLSGREPEGLQKNRVESLQLQIVRGLFDGVELELIQPVGESFFLKALEEYGDGLQHLAFAVRDIDGCLEKARAVGIELVDQTARQGSHGKIAFIKPARFAPLYVEMVEPK